MDHWIADLTTEVLWAPDMAAARDGFRRLAAQAGVDSYAYAKFETPGAFAYMDTSFCAGWVDRYVGQGYHRVDPVVAAGARTHLPFAWRFLVNRPELPGPQRQVFEEAADFNIRDALSIPFHGRRGYAGIASLVFSDPRRLREAVQAQPNLRLLALYYHSAVERLLEEEEESAGLTPFERQCLTWAAAGRSLWEISAATNRAETDVAGALRATREKLGVATTSQAAAKAIGQGLIVV
jgi:DNA-binding CsgD family transcriptional regulator